MAGGCDVIADMERKAGLMRIARRSLPGAAAVLLVAYLGFQLGVNFSELGGSHDLRVNCRDREPPLGQGSHGGTNGNSGATGMERLYELGRGTLLLNRRQRPAPKSSL
jgi:hypothetical protein